MGICASKAGEEAKKHQLKKHKTGDVDGNDTAEEGKKADNVNANDDFAKKVEEAIPADVYMISGCCDEQTSADVANTNSFNLPDDVGVSGAGGACTNALLAQVTDSDFTESFGKVMTDANEYLKRRRYTQKPNLSTSRKHGMDEVFSIIGGQTGKKLALNIGINYVNCEKGKLKGCVNDALAWNNYLQKIGFASADMQICTDDAPQDGDFPEDLMQKNGSSYDDLMAAFDWIAQNTKAGDVAVVTFSGHGTQVTDHDGNEADGKDEAICPGNYKDSGFINDDLLLERLVTPLPSGARLICIMDCCHSGSILDLPYTFLADDNGVKMIAEDPTLSTKESDGFVGQITKYGKKFGKMFGF